MLQSLSTSRRRLLALGILVIFILVFAVIVVEPYMMIYKNSVDHLDTQVFNLKQDKKAIQKKKFYSAEINRLKRAYRKEDVYLRSNKIALATAEIQQIIKSISDKSGAELLSSQTLIEDQAQQGKVGIQIRARTDIFGLRKLLHALEAGKPRLFIDEITVSRGSRAVFRFRDTESTSQVLDIRLHVFGFIKSS